MKIVKLTRTYLIIAALVAAPLVFATAGAQASTTTKFCGVLNTLDPAISDFGPNTATSALQANLTQIQGVIEIAYSARADAPDVTLSALTTKVVNALVNERKVTNSAVHYSTLRSVYPSNSSYRHEMAVLSNQSIAGEEAYVGAISNLDITSSPACQAAAATTTTTIKGTTTSSTTTTVAIPIISVITGTPVDLMINTTEVSWSAPAARGIDRVALYTFKGTLCAGSVVHSASTGYVASSNTESGIVTSTGPNFYPSGAYSAYVLAFNKAGPATSACFSLGQS